MIERAFQLKPIGKKVEALPLADCLREMTRLGGW